MSIDLKIMIRPNGDQCDFEVSGWPTNAPPARFPRVKPVVNPTDMETLRRGSALPLDVDRIAANLNLWALGADFGALMQTIVNAAPEPLRLIFDIGDPQRFPEFNDLPIPLTGHGNRGSAGRRMALLLA